MTTICSKLAPYQGAHFPPGAHVVNLSHDAPDESLKLVHRTLGDRLILVDGPSELAARIGQLRDCAERPLVLDLISHTNANEQLMVFKGWTVKAGDELDRVCEAIQKISDQVAAVRLIGCAAAGLPAGKEVLRYIQGKLGNAIEVSGTTTDVDVLAFQDAQGVPQSHYVGGALWRTTDPGKAVSALLASTGRAPSILRAGVDARPELQDLYRELDPLVDLRKAAVRNGLLTLPLATAQLHFVQVDVLGPWRSLRLWSHDKQVAVVVPIVEGQEAACRELLGLGLSAQ
ncbi:MAG TPA: hypothetical protein PKU97_05130 [Kofleriaceae bacterium]|nr:hypothetical protein [Kofleriaceae bacterium]